MRAEIIIDENPPENKKSIVPSIPMPITVKKKQSEKKIMDESRESAPKKHILL